MVYDNYHRFRFHKFTLVLHQISEISVNLWLTMAFSHRLTLISTDSRFLCISFGKTGDWVLPYFLKWIPFFDAGDLRAPVSAKEPGHANGSPDSAHGCRERVIESGQRSVARVGKSHRSFVPKQPVIRHREQCLTIRQVGGVDQFCDTLITL